MSEENSAWTDRDQLATALIQALVDDYFASNPGTDPAELHFIFEVESCAVTQLAVVKGADGQLDGYFSDQNDYEIGEKVHDLWNLMDCEWRLMALRIELASGEATASFKTAKECQGVDLEDITPQGVHQLTSQM